MVSILYVNVKRIFIINVLSSQPAQSMVDCIAIIVSVAQLAYPKQPLTSLPSSIHRAEHVTCRRL